MTGFRLRPRYIIRLIFSSAYDMVLNKTRVERIYEVRRGGRVVTVRRCGYFWVRGWSAKGGLGTQRHTP
jgi:hypothetical protein